MNKFSGQAGLFNWQIIFTLFTIGFFAVVGIKVVPLYLNQMKINAAVKQVAADAKLSNDSDVLDFHRSLQRHWDIETISGLKATDVKVVRTDTGRFLAYDYDARVHLFYNVDVVAHFQDQVQIHG